MGRALQHAQLAPVFVQHQRCRQADGHRLLLEALEGGKGAVGIERQVGEAVLVEEGLRLFQPAFADVEFRTVRIDRDDDATAVGFVVSSEQLEAVEDAR